MMRTLQAELADGLRGRVCLVGIGNPDRGDDGFGLRLAEALGTLGCSDVILAERLPERWMERMTRGGFQTVLFLDAVDMGAAPGSVVLLKGDEIAARYPQVSTHKLSLGTLARLIEAEGDERVLLLGVQPQSVAEAVELSEPVRITLEILRDLLAEILTAPTEPLAACGERP
jgi:hydrogenase 3 maturation protease